MRTLALTALCLFATPIWAQDPAASVVVPTVTPDPPDPIATIVGRLDLERYKATIKSLTQFGDRRQGTERNRAAIDWIEAQLKSHGCANIARLKYTYFPSDAELPSGPPIARKSDSAVGGARYRGIRSHTGVNT